MQATVASITRPFAAASPLTAVVRRVELFFSGADFLALLTPVTLGRLLSLIGQWLSIDWRQVADQVRRLRQGIFTASHPGDRRVGNWQTMDAPSAERRITEPSAGRKTACIDGLG